MSKAISDKARRLVDQLYGSWQQRWFHLPRPRSAKTVCGLLKDLSELNEVGTLYAFCHFILDADTDVRRAAAYAIDRVVRTARWSTEDWRHLYRTVGYIDEKWDRLQISDVTKLIFDEQFRCSLLGIASLHSNGYVRQEAVRLLTELRDGTEFPFLILRLNDWVKQVRDDALTAVQSRLCQAYVRHIRQFLPLIINLLEFTRHDQSAVVTQAVSLLSDASQDVLLHDAMQDSDRRTRRRVLQIVMAAGGEAAQRAVRYGLDSPDQVIRLWSLRHIRDFLPEGEVSAVVKRGLQDRSMPVRREATLYAASMATTAGFESEIWRNALLDANASIRNLAQFRLRQAGESDVAAVYRQILSVDSRSIEALSGLSETGDASDETVFRHYIEDSTECRRRAALRGMCRIKCDSFVEELVIRMRDDSPKVTREVEKLLRDRLPVVVMSALYRAVEEDHRPHVRSSALRLLFSSGKWRGLPWLIRGIGHPDAVTARQAELLARRWIISNRVFTRPSDAELFELRDASEAVRNIASSDLLRELQREIHRH